MSNYIPFLPTLHSVKEMYVLWVREQETDTPCNVHDRINLSNRKSTIQPIVKIAYPLNYKAYVEPNS